jgi:lipocalin
MKYLIVIAFALFGAVLAREYDRPCRFAEMSPNVKSSFQVLPYMGTWYEIRRYESPNQTDFDCVTARYTPNPDGSVQVLNSGYFGGRFIDFTGVATLANPNEVPLRGKLDVRFAPGRKKIYLLLKVWKLIFFSDQNQLQIYGHYQLITLTILSYGAVSVFQKIVQEKLHGF